MRDTYYARPPSAPPVFPLPPDLRNCNAYTPAPRAPAQRRGTIALRRPPPLIDCAPNWNSYGTQPAASIEAATKQLNTALCLRRGDVLPPAEFPAPILPP